MQTVTTVGLDIAKSVFQVHGVDAEGNVLIRRGRNAVTSWHSSRSCSRVSLASKPAPSQYIIGRASSRRLGITCDLMPQAYVKPYVKRQKNDATDAEAICEAVTRADIRFVETKTPEQQSCLMLHRTRQLFIRQQTSVINAIRAHMAEFRDRSPGGAQGCRAPACYSLRARLSSRKLTRPTTPVDCSIPSSATPVLRRSARAPCQLRPHAFARMINPVRWDRNVAGGGPKVALRDHCSLFGLQRKEGQDGRKTLPRHCLISQKKPSKKSP